MSFSYHKANKNRITPKLEGVGRPNWAQIEAELCVSDLGGLFFCLLYTSDAADE